MVFVRRLVAAPITVVHTRLVFFKALHVSMRVVLSQLLQTLVKDYQRRNLKHGDMN